MKSTLNSIKKLVFLTLVLGLITNSVFAQFSGDYAVGNWTTILDGNGTVNTAGAPASIVLSSPDDGSSSNDVRAKFSITIPATGQITFDWDYFTSDCAPCDPVGYTLGGVDTQLSDNGGGNTQSGTNVVVNVTAGQVFMFYADGDDDCCGTGDLTISNFSGPVPAPTISITAQTNVSCNGGSNGSLTATVTPGLANYTYSWSNGSVTSNTSSTTNTISSLVAGAYTVTVTDANANTATASTTITQPTALSAGIITDSSVSCNGFSDGGLTADGTGGTPPYSFAWSNSGTTASITGLAAGTYTVTVTDSNLCTSTSAKIISEPTVLTASATTDQNASCASAADGRIIASASGGTTAYSYLWSNASTTQSVNSLSAGTYTVTVTDANGCTVADSDVVASGAMPVDKTVTAADNSLCIGDSTTIEVASSELDIAYFLRNDANDTVIGLPKFGDGFDLDFATGALSSNISFNVLAQKPVSGIGLDFDGDNDYVNVPGPSNIPLFNSNYTIEAWINAGSMGDRGIVGWGGFGGDNQVTALRLTGDGIKHYWWNNDLDVTTGDITGGWHHVAAAFDGTTRKIYLDGQLVASDLPTGHNVLNANNFAIGRTNFTEYFHGKIDEVRVWNVARTDDEIKANMYNALAGNESGLVAYYNFEENNGTTGYDKTANANNGSLVNMNSSDWITGAKTSSCAIEMNDVVSVNVGNVSASVNVENITCNGETNGELEAAATGGSTPYSYNWSNGATTPDIEDLSEGTYTVTITDACGITSVDSGVIVEPAALAVTATVDSNVTCNGLSDGGVSAGVATGGTASYRYSWVGYPIHSNTDLTTGGGVIGSGQVGTNYASEAFDGTPDVWRSDQQNNAWVRYNFGHTTRKAIMKYTVQNGDFTGPESWVLQGSNDNINWSDLDTVSGQTWAGNEVKTYTMLNYVAYQYYRLAEISFHPAPGDAFDIREIEMFEEQDRQSLTGLSADTYYLMARDANGCAVSEPAVVTEPDVLTISIDSFNNVSSNGSADGSVSITVTGGTPAYTFNWTSGASSEDDTGLSGGTHGVTVTDVNGCSDNASQFVSEPPLLTSPAANTSYKAPLTISYTLPNVPQSGTVALQFVGSTTVNLVLNDDLTNTFNWDLATDPALLTEVVSADATSLPDDTYDVTLFYIPSGGVAMSDVNTNVTIDTQTEVPVLNEPVANTIYSNPITIDYALPEAPLSGSVKLVIGDSSSTVATLTLDNALSNSFSWDVTTDPSALSEVDSFSGSVLGNDIYTFTLQYQDTLGNTIATDIHVNVAICPAGPTVVTRNITRSLNGAGTVSITAVEIDSASFSHCGIDSIWLDQTDFACGDIGNNTVTLTVADANGLQSTSTATVTIEDNTAPVVATQNIIIQLDSAGQAAILGTDIDDGTTDNCTINSRVATPNSFTCGEVGANTVTLTVTDDQGNASTSTATVTVEDNIDPVAIAQDITVQLDSTGNVVITGTDVDNGSTDNCSIASRNVTSTTFTCTEVGANSVTLTVTDASGNTNTATATVTVEDNVNPVVVTKDITVQLDSAGQITITGTDVDDSSSDNCSIDSRAVSPNSFTCAEAGSNTVTLTVTDANGNTGTGTAQVTVEDNINPIVVTKNITVQLDSTGNVSIVASDVDDASTDNCGIATRSVNPASFTCGEVGANTVTLTITDDSGNSSTGTAEVTVEETIPPVATAQNITVQLDSSGAVSITGNDVDNGSTDNCAINARSVSPSSFACTEVGNNTVTLTVTDGSGNTHTSTATVTVEDVISPVVVTKDITVQLDSAGQVSIVGQDVDDNSTDNCTTDTWAATPNSFTCAEAGSNTVTLTLTDVNGNTATGTAQVTVEDNTDPVVVTKDITVQLDSLGAAAIVATDVDNGSTDNCSIASQSVTPTNFTCAEVGANVVTLTVTDVSGNSNTETATVTIVDDINPVAAAIDITVQLDASGLASITGLNVDNSSSDNCSVDTMTVTPHSFTCAEVGNNTVTLTVTDVNGNASTTTSTVTIEDNVDPVVVTKDITVQLDGAGQITIAGQDVDDSSSDNCAIDTWTVTPNSFTCAETGSNSVTLTLTDVNGNTATGTAQVTVADSAAPQVVTKDITVQLDSLGAAAIVATDVDNGSTDNCSIASQSVTPTNFTCAEVGANVVTLTVTDVSGNSNTETATVTIVDDIDPVAAAKNITIQLDGSGLATITGPDVDNSSSDNCSVDTMTVTPHSFTCAEVGNNTVTLTVTDDNGNASTTTSTVTIEDNADPVVVTKDITVQLDGAGQVTITGQDVDDSSSDNCSIDNWAVTPNSFTCAESGSNTVTLTLTDVNGNTSTGTAQVTVEDTELPVVVTKDVTVQIDSFGTATITANDVNDNSTDNCNIDTITVVPTSFSCSEVGNNVATLTVTDVSGNSSSATATVTVVDNMQPAAIATDITVQLNNSGWVMITGQDVDLGSVDNCTIDTRVVTPSGFTCSEVSSNVVTLTVTDVNGNSSTTTSNVVVEDNVPPVVATKDITVQLDSLGQASITEQDIDDGSTDNCTIDTWTVIPNSFACADVGSHTVTLILTDVNGNVSNATAEVTVADSAAPVVITQNITVQLDATGNASISAADVDNGSSDNCSIDTRVVSQDAFTCNEVGVNTITLTVTDIYGNSSSETVKVIVEDTLSPAALAQDITIQLNDRGEASLLAADVDNGSNDNCAIDNLIVTPNTFTCNEVGVNPVVFTAVDVNGNTGSQTINVTVEDATAPTISLSDITVQLDTSGSVVITPADIDNGSSDNCAILSSTINPTGFTCAELGSNMVTMTITDVNNNSTTQIAFVTVEDNIHPVAVAKDITLQLDSSGQVSITASDVDDGSFDNCAISTQVTPNSFGCGDVGDNTVTLTVTDDGGNTSDVTATVTVEDHIAPVAMAMDITVELDSTGHAMITPRDIDNGATDNCLIATQQVTPNTFTCNSVGANTVTLTTTDFNGNVTDVTAVVTIQDNIAPVLACEATEVALDNTGVVHLQPEDVDNGSFDNCAVFSRAITPDMFYCDGLGVQSVMLTVSDVHGNSSTCSVNVTVVDTTAPDLVTNDVVIYLDSSGNTTLDFSQVDANTTDNCNIKDIYLETTRFDCDGIGNNIVKIVATDNSDNESLANVNVEVLDTIAPVIFTETFNAYLDEHGKVTIDPADVDAGSYDNCGIKRMRFNNSTFNCNNGGTNHVTLTVEDLHGNVSTKSTAINVMDTLKPEIACPGNIDVCATSPLGVEVNYQVDASDNCHVTDLTRLAGLDDGRIFPVGATEVRYLATDESNNQSDCSFMVTVHEEIEVDLGDDKTICDTTDFHLQVDMTKLTTVQWSTGAVDGSIDIDKTDTYWVDVTDIYGCKAADTVKIEVIKDCMGVGIAETGASGLNEINVYPNPTKDILFINNLGNASFEVVELFDLQGRLIEQINVTLGAKELIKIDMSAFNHGVYILKLKGQSGSFVERVVLSK